MRYRSVAVLAACAVAVSCAIRLGPGKEELRVVALTTAPRPSAEPIGELLGGIAPDVVFLAAGREWLGHAGAHKVTDEDTAWFRKVAAVAGLAGSGPGFEPHYGRIRVPGGTSPLGMSVLTRWEQGGDTTLAPFVSGHDSTGRGFATGLPIHHVKSRTRQGRDLHLLLVEGVDEVTPRESTAAVVEYLARNVPREAVVLLALRATDNAYADSLGALLSHTFEHVDPCADERPLLATIQPGALRLFFRPESAVRCVAARSLAAPFPALLAHFALDD